MSQPLYGLQLSMSHASDMLWALAHNVTAQQHKAEAPPTRVDSTFNLADHSQHGKPPSSAKASPKGKTSAGSSPTGPEVWVHNSPKTPVLKVVRMSMHMLMQSMTALHQVEVVHRLLARNTCAVL